MLLLLRDSFFLFFAADSFGISLVVGLGVHGGPWTPCIFVSFLRFGSLFFLHFEHVSCFVGCGARGPWEGGRGPLPLFFVILGFFLDCLRVSLIGGGLGEGGQGGRGPLPFFSCRRFGSFFLRCQRVSCFVGCGEGGARGAVDPLLFSGQGTLHFLVVDAFRISLRVGLGGQGGLWTPFYFFPLPWKWWWDSLGFFSDALLRFSAELSPDIFSFSHRI